MEKHRPDKVSLDFNKLTWGCSCAIDTLKDDYMLDFLHRMNDDYRQTSNIRHTLVGNIIVDNSDHSNTLFQWTGHWQLQDEMGNI